MVHPDKCKHPQAKEAFGGTQRHALYYNNSGQNEHFACCLLLIISLVKMLRCCLLDEF